MSKVFEKVSIDGLVVGAPPRPRKAKAADARADARADAPADAMAGAVRLGRLADWALPALVMGAGPRVPVPEELRGRDFILLSAPPGGLSGISPVRAQWTARRQRPEDVMSHVVFPRAHFHETACRPGGPPAVLAVPPSPEAVFGTEVEVIAVHEVAGSAGARVREEAAAPCRAWGVLGASDSDPGSESTRKKVAQKKKKKALPPAPPLAPPRFEQVRPGPRRRPQPRAVDTSALAPQGHRGGRRYLVNSYSAIAASSPWATSPAPLVADGASGGDDAGAPAMAASSVPYDTRIGAFGFAYRSMNVGGRFVWRRALPPLFGIARDACAERGAFVSDDVIWAVAEEADLALRQAAQFLLSKGAASGRRPGPNGSSEAERRARSPDTQRAMVEAMLIFWSVSRGASSTVLGRGAATRAARELHEMGAAGSRVAITRAALGMTAAPDDEAQAFWATGGGDGRGTRAAARYLARVARRAWLAHVPSSARDVADPWASKLPVVPQRESPPVPGPLRVPPEAPGRAARPGSQLPVPPKTATTATRRLRPPDVPEYEDPRGYAPDGSDAPANPDFGRSIEWVLDAAGAGEEAHHRWTATPPDPALAQTLARRLGEVLGFAVPAGDRTGPFAAAMAACAAAKDMYEALGDDTARELFGASLMARVVLPTERAWEYEAVPLEDLRVVFEARREARKLAQMEEYAGLSAGDRRMVREFRKGGAQRR